MKKKILLMVIIILIVLGIILIPSKNNKEDKTELEEIEKICLSIQKNNKERIPSILILKSNKNSNVYIENSIYEFKEKYKNENVYDVDFKYLKTNCIKKMLEQNVYNTLLNNESSVVIYFNDGTYMGMIGNPSSLDMIETPLLENKIIKHQKIKENITYEIYEENKKSEYVLVILTDETKRKSLQESMEKVFPNIKKNIVNKESDLGIKIMEDIEKQFKVKKVYPQVFYFKNGKVIESEGVISERMFIGFKEMINKKLKNE